MCELLSKRSLLCFYILLFKFLQFTPMYFMGHLFAIYGKVSTNTHKRMDFILTPFLLYIPSGIFLVLKRYFQNFNKIRTYETVFVHFFFVENLWQMCTSKDTKMSCGVMSSKLVTSGFSRLVAEHLGISRYRPLCNLSRSFSTVSS